MAPFVTKRVRNGKVTYDLDLTWPLVILTLLLAVLKLAVFESWSWWVVTSPLWVPAALTVAMVALVWGLWLVLSVWMVLTGRPVQAKYTFKRR